MKTTVTKLLWVIAIAGMVTLLLSTPLFAQNCPELVYEGVYTIQTAEDL